MSEDDLVFAPPTTISPSARWRRQRRRHSQHEFLEEVKPKVRKKRKRKKRRRRPRNVYLYDHPWNRYREKIDPAVSEPLGKRYLHFPNQPQPTLVGDFGTVLRYPSVHRTSDVLHQKIRDKYRTGGPFSSVKCTVPTPEVQAIGRYEGNDFRPYGALEIYEGGFAPANWGTGFSVTDFMLSGSDDSPIDADYGDSSPFGAEAWDKFKPDPFGGDTLGVTIGESHETPRMLRTTAGGFRDIWNDMGGSPTRFGPKKVAEHFLNTQFGWIPFVNDMKNLYKAHTNIDTTLRNAISRNGKWHDRGGVLYDRRNSTERTVIENYAGVVTPALSSGFYDSAKFSLGIPVRTELYQQTEDKVWFKGRFRYWVPSLEKNDDAYYNVMNRIRAYGFKISPALVWNLTPWSWLADWFTNAGNVINNLSAGSSDNIAAQFAYVMRKTKLSIVNQSTIHLKNGPVNCLWRQEIDSKKRAEASPFGFGLSNQTLSIRQQLILVALGVTRYVPG